jgi:hypothetical protein
MHVPPNLTPVLWSATAVSCAALIALGGAFTLMLGNVRQQKSGLRLLWVSLAVLAAAATAVILVVSHS